MLFTEELWAFFTVDELRLFPALIGLSPFNAEALRTLSANTVVHDKLVSGTYAFTHSFCAGPRSSLAVRSVGCSVRSRSTCNGTRTRCLDHTSAARHLALCVRLWAVFH
jgi:hypothetical protein